MNIIWNKHTRNLVLWILCNFFSIKKGRVMCVCWGGTKYNCNPRAITDKMVEMGFVGSKFEVTYAFVNPAEYQNELPTQIRSVQIGSLRYFYLLATSQFIIANTRFGGGLYWPFHKKRGQYYIQTMHGGHGLKKVELDVEETLSEEYVKGIFEDSSRIDLMISDSAFWTHCAKTAFAFPKGEILEVGLPRNDVFFAGDIVRENYRSMIASIVSSQKGNAVPSDVKYLVYCPTFRSNGRRDVYSFDPGNLVAALETKFNGTWYILVSSHPNMKNYYKTIYDFSHPRMVDVGGEDLQPILVSSDAALTDYSSAGFEFALTKRPVFLLCRDKEDYDRGFYINPEDLPFPYAETDDELIANILNLDNDKYMKDLEKFNKEVIGLNETGHAAEAVVEWMISKVR